MGGFPLLFRIYLVQLVALFLEAPKELADSPVSSSWPQHTLSTLDSSSKCWYSPAPVCSEKRSYNSFTVWPNRLALCMYNKKRLQVFNLQAYFATLCALAPEVFLNRSEKLWEVTWNHWDQVFDAEAFPSGRNFPNLVCGVKTYAI